MLNGYFFQTKHKQVKSKNLLNILAENRNEQRKTKQADC